MPRFRYQAITASGATERGEMDAENRLAAFRQLQQADKTPVKVLDAGDGSLRAVLDMELGARTISHADRAALLGELAALLKAGLTVEEAVDLTVDIADNRLARAALGDAAQALRAGTPLSRALDDRRLAFAGADLALIAAGERSGALGPILSRLAEQQAQALSRRSALVSALVYPAILTLTACAVIILMVTVVVPQFEPVFAAAGTDLPWLTAQVRALSTGIVAGLPFAALTVAVLAVAVPLALRRPDTRLHLDGWLLALPGLGRFLLLSQAARFARALALLLEGGVALQSALTLSARTVTNRALGKRYLDMVAAVQQGTPLWRAMTGTGVMTPRGLRLIRLGEETASLPATLKRIADSAEHDIDTALKRATALLTPAVTLIMGGVVGIIVWSVMSAILDINRLV